MRNKKMISSALAALCVLSVGACGGGNSGGGRTAGTQASDNAQTTLETPAATLASEDIAALLEGEEEVEKLENPTLKFLASWTINPQNGKPKTPALEMFEQQYGGKVEDIVCTWEQRYQTLGTLVAAGDAPDMFSAEDHDVCPRGPLYDMFSPLDEYIDFDSELWAPMKDVNGLFEFKGKHYAGIYNINAGDVMIYNKKTFTENGLTTPAELLEQDNWNWDTFYDMMIQYCDDTNGKYAVDGWWFEGAFSLTTGVPYIGIEGDKIVCNFENDLIGRVQEFFLKMNNEKLQFPKSDFEWQIHPERVGQGLTLFYPCGMWALEDTDLMSQLGEPDEIAFAPMPKCPYADAYYLPIKVYGFSLVAGAKNPKATAAYLDCSIKCRDNEAAAAISKKQFEEDYHWTEEMFEMREKIKNLTLEHPIIEYYEAVNDKIKDLVNNPFKETYNNGVAWSTTKETYKVMIQKELDIANETLAKQ